MDLSATWVLPVFGLTGLAGSIVFIAGDLLYNDIPGSTDSPAVKMSAMPEARLQNAGTLGLIGCWLYTLASLHPYTALRPAGETFAAIFLLAFAATMIGYGVAHTAYFAIAAGAKTALKAGSDPGWGGQLGSFFYHRLVLITYIPVAVASLMMLYAIAAGRSLYPRWMVFFTPVVIYLLKVPLTGILKGRLQELVRNSYDNLVLFVYYLISTILLWNGSLF